MVQLKEVVANMHVWILLYGENDPTHWIVIVHHATLYILQAVSDILHVPM